MMCKWTLFFLWLGGALIGWGGRGVIDNPKIDPACRDIEAKYQALIRDEGPDAQPAISTKVQDDD